MIKFLPRLLVFFIGVPAVAALILFLPHMNHLAVNILVIAASSMGAAEFAVMLKKKDFPVSVPEAAVLGSLSPIAMTLTVSFNLNGQITEALFIIGVSWLFVSEVIFRRGSFVPVIHRLAGGFSVMMYPGLFLIWIIKMSLCDNSEFVILLFMLTVMANDSIAWTMGTLFGRGNQGFFKASPNKSIAGFIGGLLASIAVCTAAAYFFPHIFAADQIPPLPSGILLGFFCGIAVVLGDLAESLVKRSCDIKDSGFIVPGRGGILDSTDSIALTAPVFYVLYRFFF
ncbi:MAG: phosphatidate cytidylyltransferase [Treponema sp.]|jgi:phosphatidate cytidylyltransferase|nr:phosphatidate cytidylyltransferase [Treponema sp.]